MSRSSSPLRTVCSTVTEYTKVPSSSPRFTLARLGLGGHRQVLPGRA
ncbi:MAG: hypothetical protein LH605_01115 [Microbacteriaceae bacterium]|nr:hypothetical protein [Microbacteriaceae bacterium]